MFRLPGRTARRLSTLSLIVTFVAAACSGAGPSSSPTAVNSSAPSAAASAAPPSSAASSTPIDQVPVTVVLADYGNTASRQGDVDEYKKLNPNSKINVDVQLWGASDEELMAKLRLALASGGELPDILNLNYREVPELAPLLADLTGPLSDIWSDVEPGAQKLATQFDGRVLGVPYQVNYQTWFYRKDLFAQAGIDPAAVRTQADFIAAGKKLLAKFPKHYIWNLGSSPQSYQYGLIMSGNGAKFLDKAAPGCSFVVATDPGVRNAFQALKDLQDAGVVAPVSDFTPEWEQAIADGTVSSMLSASWLASYIPQYAPDQKGQWGVAPWPEIGGAVGGTDDGGALLLVLDKAPHRDAAIAYLKAAYLTKETALARFQRLGKPPVVVSAQTDPAYTAGNDYFGPALPAFLSAAGPTAKVFPFDPEAIRETASVLTGLVTYLTTNTPLDKVLADTQAEMTSTIGCPYK
jgi:ABC-type glycerol-3-phosphate transport system substrate-binding protein